MLRYALGVALAGVSSLALAACGQSGAHISGDSHGPMKAVSRLDCPDAQGSLSRKAAAADGRSCDYAGPDGAVVALTLADMTGKDADAVLDPLGRDLRAELPKAPPTPATPDRPKDKENEKVDIDLPGVHIHANGDHATVDAGPADGGKNGVRVNANDNGAEVHVDDRSGSGVRKLMVLTADKPGPHGYSVAAYDARGPASGPLVVAAVRAKDHDHDALMHDVGELVRRNVGG
ncbi:hypothetical protein ACO2Q3_08735 [Caulobacter sp. KR2-114]|uniref:hypothetical protein n=1 Tax=Caulobacter sp. KR2-114 TaxID=3400912 RepID=UPI003C0CC9DD